MRKKVTGRPSCLILCLAGCVTVAPGCAVKRWVTGTPAPSVERGNPQYQTEEELLAIVTELQRAADTDTYRFPIPKDVTGANVYKATLARLRDYEAKHPGAYAGLVAFTRARAYEGLREYEQAIAHYHIVSQTSHRLRDEAAQAADILARFQELRQRSLTAPTPSEYLRVLDARINDWQVRRQEVAGTRYEPLARQEEELLDQQKVAFLLVSRHHLEDGNSKVVEAYQQLLAKHRESKNFYRYQLELGDFYFTLAQEYVARNDPETLAFHADTFAELSQAALRLYARVAQVDGMMEKLEAKGKLEALKAYMAQVGQLSLSLPRSP
jgi:hypothetical protein